MSKKARRIRHRCPETDSVMVMKFRTIREKLDDIDEVEFWYDTQTSDPTIINFEDLVEGFDKAGYSLVKKPFISEIDEQEQRDMLDM